MPEASRTEKWVVFWGSSRTATSPARSRLGVAFWGSMLAASCLPWSGVMRWRGYGGKAGAPRCLAGSANGGRGAWVIGGGGGGEIGGGGVGLAAWRLWSFVRGAVPRGGGGGAVWTS